MGGKDIREQEREGGRKGKQGRIQRNKAVVVAVRHDYHLSLFPSAVFNGETVIDK